MFDPSQIGFPCPECAATIRPRISQMVSGQPIYCPGCGLRLTVDVGASAASLKELETSEQQQQRANELYRQATRFGKPSR